MRLPKAEQDQTGTPDLHLENRTAVQSNLRQSRGRNIRSEARKRGHENVSYKSCNFQIRHGNTLPIEDAYLD